MSTVRTNTLSRIRTPNRRPLHHPVTVTRRPDIPGVAVEACSAASTTVDRRPADPVSTRGAHPVASNWRADDPVAAVLRSAALLWGHDLLTHPFSHFDTNFLHPAARIRAFSSCSWKGRKFSVIEAKLGVYFLGGGEFESFRGKKFPFWTRDSPSSGRQASVSFSLLPLLQDLLRFSIRFDFFSLLQPEMGGDCVVILKLTDEIGRQGTDFRVWCCKEERIPVWFFCFVLFCRIEDVFIKFIQSKS